MISKSIFITGCSSGIDLCVARGLRQRGHRVFASARRDEDVTRLRGEGLESLRLDPDQPESIRAAINEALEHTGGTLDALFNNRCLRPARGSGGSEPRGATRPVRNQPVRHRGTHRPRHPGDAPPRSWPHHPEQLSVGAGGDALPRRLLRLELKGSGIHVSLIEPGPITSRFRSNAYRMYLRYIDPSLSVHRERYQIMEQRLLKQGPAAPFTLPPENRSGNYTSLTDAIRARR